MNKILNEIVPNKVLEQLESDIAKELKPLESELFSSSLAQEVTFDTLESSALKIRQCYGELLIKRVLEYKELSKKKTSLPKMPGKLNRKRPSFKVHRFVVG